MAFSILNISCQSQTIFPLRGHSGLLQTAQEESEITEPS
jgi:hypothetical protein